MWTSEHQNQFEALLEVLKKEPGRTITPDEKKLIEHLMICYIEAKPEPYAEIEYYNKLAALFDILLKNFFEKNPMPVTAEELAIYKTVRNHLAKAFPIFGELEKFIILKLTDALKRSQNAYQQFIQNAGKTLGSLEKDYINPNLVQSPQKITHCYSSPEVVDHHDAEIYQRAYCDMLREMTQSIKNSLTSNEEASLQALINTYYQLSRIKALDAFIKMYKTLDLLQIQNIPHLYYKTSDTDQFSSDDAANTVTQHSIFQKLVVLTFKTLTDPKKPNAEKRAWGYAMGCVLVKEQAELKDYQVKKKMMGQEAGFMLISPDKSRTYFAKYTPNTIADYFYGQVLSRLGVKMPESKLLFVGKNIPFLLTLDLSRKYEKGQTIKEKKFTMLGDVENIHLKSPNMIFGNNSSNLPTEEQEKNLEVFLKTTLSTEKSRISFAKLLILIKAFDLKDLFTHGGNMGLITTEKKSGSNQNNKTYNKLGMVDFGIIHSKESWTSIFNWPENKNALINEIKLLSNPIPLFNHMTQLLTENDILLAAKELQQPKQRTYHFGFLQALPEKTLAAKIIEDAHKEIEAELKLAGITDNKFFESLKNSANNMTNNLTNLLSILLKPVAKSEAQLEQTLKV